ncbi:alpha/beta fold hydrolase [Acrocarpospora catenulata]|uniref:alpha/beta fold hydrolase n=1 Tax=Acrocarpospora catenulata TaxID=2836182 RepID=UPI001BDB2442|nr:alpha/beta hydrolase [Acrocarpospora catenulata]
MTGSPVWFSSALAAPFDAGTVEVAGCPIHYKAWGESGRPVTVLVHGGAAHMGWWDHIGPHLAGDQRVVALDLSGHGDSGRRSSYSLELWADEVMAVAAAEGPGDPAPILIGHSMGGFVTLTAAIRFDHLLRGAVAIDSAIKEIPNEAAAWRRPEDDYNGGVPVLKVYPTREKILQRFRTLPEDPAGIPYIRDHIAAGSIRPTEGGWTWKFDPKIFLRSRMRPEQIARVSCATALMLGERGLTTMDRTLDTARRLGGSVPVTLVPDAGHHIMLDQPIALITALRTLVSQWRPLR